MSTTIKTGLAAILLVAFSCQKESSVIADKSSTGIVTGINDPGKYISINIHGQRWMTTNLAVTHYRNGDKIPEVRLKARWDTLRTGAWCWYNNDSATYAATYGKLYNWYAVRDPRGLAPTGWHVASNAEWDTLAAHLGNNAGGKLKDTGTIEAGTGLWYAPNTGANNKTGFTGLPGGLRSSNGSFGFIGVFGYWWSSTEYNTNSNAWYSALSYGDGQVSRSNSYEPYGFSVRCLRD